MNWLIPRGAGHLAPRLDILAAWFWDRQASIFSPKGTPAHYIFGLSIFVLAITAAIFLVAGGVLTYVLIRYRRRATDVNDEPPQIYGSTQIELSWTVIPVIIVVVLFLTTARVIFSTEYATKPSGALDVVVIGHQYWWEYRYPKLGIVTANELHIPVDDPARRTPVYLEMSSADTVHSFWVPQLAGKTDVIPNRVNVMWMDAETPGLFLGQCAQYCGVQHAKMLLRVYAQSQSDFDAWAAQQRQAARPDASTKAGQIAFLRHACISCHTIRGTVAAGRFGPDLTHLASRDTIASGAVQNTAENLRKWIDDPGQMKPGCLMPPMHLNNHDLDVVTAYLMTLH